MSNFRTRLFNNLPYGETKMDFKLPSDFMDVEEAKPVPAGLYTVRITDVEEGKGKDSGLAMLIVTMDIPDQPKAAGIVTYIQIPGQEGLKNPEWTALNMKRFLTTFGIDFESGSFSTDSIPGQQAEVKLKLEHDDNYGDKNAIQFAKLT